MLSPAKPAEMDHHAGRPATALRDELAAIAAARQSRRDAWWSRLSGAGIVIGVGVAVAAYFVSHLTRDPLVQRDAIVMALAANAFTVACAALFVFSATTHFLRFWLARLLYAQAAANNGPADDDD
jgi:ABC-type Fe3+-siderophore transport system permease subunit